ncbi:MAG: dihydropteroate synthase [Planctomycetota bacterium]
MGILNVTPDSFSDGGKYAAVDVAVKAGITMAEHGADIIDIGGESTRPYADPVDAKTELARVQTVIESLAQSVDIPISIDTSKALVARRAIESGAEIINDVTGLTGDPGMIDVAVDCGVGICAMHMQGNPQTMQDNPHYDDVVVEIDCYLKSRYETCLQAGIQEEAICLDPGIGFGKTHDHNLQLMRSISRFTAIGRPILIGHSRKGFIRKTLKRDRVDIEPYDPMAGTLGVSIAAAAAGAHVLRVHDVPQTVQAIACFQACRRQSA